MGSLRHHSREILHTILNLLRNPIILMFLLFPPLPPLLSLFVPPKAPTPAATITAAIAQRDIPPNRPAGIIRALVANPTIGSSLAPHPFAEARPFPSCKQLPSILSLSGPLPVFSKRPSVKAQEFVSHSKSVLRVVGCSLGSPNPQIFHSLNVAKVLMDSE